MSLTLPAYLVDAATQQGRTSWLATLPGTVAELSHRWSLVVGEPFQPGGQTAWVAPARDADGRDVVLKVGWRHFEAEHEADGLRVWDGNGAARIYAATVYDDTTTALLLERCRPGSTLADEPEPVQDTVIAALLPRLWLVPPPAEPFRPLASMCDAWAGEFDAKVATRPPFIDAGLARAGMTLFRELPATANRAVLLCTDLHAENVLAAEREPWLVIDPKPYVGDPAYDPIQHFLNCERRLVEDPRALAYRFADLVGLDRERVLLWLFARCVQEAPERSVLVDVAARIAP